MYLGDGCPLCQIGNQPKFVALTKVIGLSESGDSCAAGKVCPGDDLAKPSVVGVEHASR